jgi:hypothetical protein
MTKINMTYNFLIIWSLFFALPLGLRVRPRPVSRKTSEDGVEIPLSDDPPAGGEEFGGFQPAERQFFERRRANTIFPLSPLHFGEGVPRLAGRVRSIDFFCLLFFIKEKKYVGF